MIICLDCHRHESKEKLVPRFLWLTQDEIDYIQSDKYKCSDPECMRFDIIKDKDVLQD